MLCLSDAFSILTGEGDDIGDFAGDFAGDLAGDFAGDFAGDRFKGCLLFDRLLPARTWFWKT